MSDALVDAGEHLEDDIIRAIDTPSSAQRIEQALQAALERLEPGDRLLLRLRYQGGHPVSRMARVLDLPQKALYRRFDLVIAILRNELERRGIRAQDVEGLVGHPTAELAALVADDAATPEVSKAL